MESRLWDWSTSRKTGSVHLKLPGSARIQYARFVNELHEQTVVLAEVSTWNHYFQQNPV